jgi:hypothetical protein
MIDLNYGHLAVDSYQHARSRSNWPWTLVDAGPQVREAAQRHGFQASPKAPLGGPVDARWTLGPEAVATRANRRV